MPRRLFAAVLALAAWALSTSALAQADPLPSWNDGTSRARIVAFVEAVTQPGGKDFVPPVERIAVFDNDGTLWAEQPMYFQLALCARPRQGAGAEESGVEDRRTVRFGAQGRT